jgi:hypothetical protein
VTALRTVLAAHPRHPGRKTLAALLDAAQRTDLALTLSELEIRFRELCDAHALADVAATLRALLAA